MIYFDFMEAVSILYNKYGKDSCIILSRDNKMLHIKVSVVFNKKRYGGNYCLTYLSVVKSKGGLLDNAFNTILEKIEYKIKGEREMKTGIERIVEERNRQLKKHGWSQEHDDEHTDDSLAMAACHYALPDKYVSVLIDLWPGSWNFDYDKKGHTTRIRDLEKAGALIAAEIDRLIRLEAKEKEK